MQPANSNSAQVLAQAGNEAASTGPRPFHETATLQSLLAPISEEEFFARYWEKKPLIVHRKTPGFYGNLFSLQDFDDWTIRGNRGYVKTAEATAKVQAKHENSTAAALERILTDMRAGHTLILDSVHSSEPKLGLLCQRLARETAARFQTNIYLTPPGGKGFTAHWDNHDVFVLQVFGSKHWKVEKDRRLLPQRDGVMFEDREIQGEPHEITLQQGDMLYLPRGTVHAAECGAEPSMHITVGIYPHTWDSLIVAAVKAAIKQDDSLRLALPLDFMKSDGAGITSRVGNELRKAADPEFLARVFDEFKDRVIGDSQFDISGSIVSAFKTDPLTLDDKIAARPGLIFRMQPGEETVTLKIGTRAITFPDFFGEALEYAINTPAYTIRELPGDLEDEEKIVFVERLIQEGMVIRK
jgi:ribosomal protein L16 Arg81 hydroxylase